MKKVSVIIPVYNAEHTLVRCVESILYGNYKNLEIVLVDDCSQDNSWKICKDLSLKYSNVKAYRNEKNRGVSYTRNVAISKSAGDYLMFVDSDDWVSCDYVKELCKLFENHEQSLIISGFYYYNLNTMGKVKYVYNQKSKMNKLVNPNLFELKNKQLLNSLWNKIFLRKFIVEENIKFDEQQSMGEDLNFVLNYIQKLDIRDYFIINAPLYYYTFSSKESLLSNYGWHPMNFSLNNINKISEICSKMYHLKNIEEITSVEIINFKRNCVFHILNNPLKSNKEKIDRLKQIIITESDKKCLTEQIEIYFKNKVLDSVTLIKRFVIKLLNIYFTIINQYIIRYNRHKLKNKEVSIISQNCIGGVFYHDMKLMFKSSTINLYFKSLDFIKFVNNIDYYLNCEISIRWNEEYPVGFLDDIEIHFMHYNTCTEATEKWKKRKIRINFNQLFIICTDMEGFDDKCWNLWKKIGYPKILFTSNKKYVNEDSVYFRKYKNNISVKNLIPHREFYNTGLLIKKINNLR